MPANDNKNSSEIDEWSEVSDFGLLIPAEIERELIEYMKWRIYGTLIPPAQPLNKGEDDASER